MRYIPIETHIHDQFDAFYALLEKLFQKRINKSINQYNVAAVTIGIYNKFMTDEIYDVINTNGEFIMLVRMKEETPKSFFGNSFKTETDNYRHFITFNEYGYKFRIIAYKWDAFDSSESALDVIEIIYSSIITIDAKEDSYGGDEIGIIPYRLICINALYRHGYIKSIDDFKEFAIFFSCIPQCIFSDYTQYNVNMEALFNVVKTLKIDYPSILRDYYSCLTLLSDDEGVDKETNGET